MFNKNDKIIDYLSPTELKKLNKVLEDAVKNVQTISRLKRKTELKRRALINPVNPGTSNDDQLRIQKETELGYKIIEELERKAAERKRREQDLRVRIAKTDRDIINSIKKEYQSSKTEKPTNKEEYQTH